MKAGKNSALVGLTFIRTAALLVWVVRSRLASVACAQHSTAPKRVLVLYWYDKDFPFNALFDRSFQAALQSAPAGTVEYYAEYLESNRFPGENHALLLRDYLRQKYVDRTIDVVVASGKNRCASSLDLAFLNRKITIETFLFDVAGMNAFLNSY